MCVIFGNHKKLRRKEGDSMTVKTEKFVRHSVPSTRFNSTKNIGRIKRVGKTIVVIDSDGKVNPISAQQVEKIKNNAINSDKPVVVTIQGLSRAQVSRVVSDLRSSDSLSVRVRQVPSVQKRRLAHRMESLSATQFEILLTGSGKDEQD